MVWSPDYLVCVFVWCACLCVRVFVWYVWVCMCVWFVFVWCVSVMNMVTWIACHLYMDLGINAGTFMY